MSGVIIIKDGRSINKVMNIKGYIEMRLRRYIDKFTCQMVGDSNNTIIFNIRTSKKRFNLIKEDLLKISKECVILEAKGLHS